MNLRNIKLPLIAGAVYFFLMAIAHLGEIKIPGLFIYFDFPSYSYQDRITALFSLGWSLFFFTAFTDPLKYKTLVRSILIAGAAAIIILCFINLETDFYSLNNSADVTIIWVQTVMLFFYWFWLVISYYNLRVNFD